MIHLSRSCVGLGRFQVDSVSVVVVFFLSFLIYLHTFPILSIPLMRIHFECLLFRFPPHVESIREKMFENIDRQITHTGLYPSTSHYDISNVD